MSCDVCVLPDDSVALSAPVAEVDRERVVAAMVGRAAGSS
jgi:hypothetical protein